MIALVVVTLVCAFVLGLVADFIRVVAQEAHQTWGAVFTHPYFWQSFWQSFGDMVNVNGLNVVLAIAFSALGCFQSLRRVVRVGRANDSAASSLN